MDDLITAQELAEQQTQSAALMYQIADQWRMNTATGRRVLYLADVPIAIYPGGVATVTDPNSGVIGERQTFHGFVSPGQDVLDNDQFRNVRDAESDEPYMPGTRFTVGSVERFRTLMRLRIHREGT